MATITKRRMAAGWVVLTLLWSASVQAGDQGRRAKLPKGFQQLESVVAVVGQHIITLSELVRAQAQNKASQRLVPTRQAERPRNSRELLRQVLNTQVDNLLVTQAAKKLGLTVADSEIDKHLKKLKDQNIWDQEELRQNLGKMGFADVASYRNHVRNEQLRMKMIRTKLGSKLRIAEAEIKRVLKLEYKGGTQEQEIHSRHILIKVPQGASPLQVNALRNKAWGIYDRIKAGKLAFVDAAEEYSDDEGTGAGGDLGWMRRWMLDPTFSRTLWSLKKDQISKVILTPFGFHIVQLLERRTVAAKNKRILEQMVRAQLVEQQFTKFYEQWLTELRSAAHVETRL
ncbi:MAG TPA: hypothetical protein DCQ06_14445 [Myxococcales bacterium]|nr:hypothetical protein [Myxococcales bacterium]HAN32790.1 hypothetical protein [Myxococcales bacterium]